MDAVRRWRFCVARIRKGCTMQDSRVMEPVEKRQLRLEGVSVRELKRAIELARVGGMFGEINASLKIEGGLIKSVSVYQRPEIK